jgi:antitoxin (DNA-binding transcriptional repressor) of toxin-antitoxin stability system
MYHMKQASVRDLRYDFPKVERMLAEGESIEITKRKRVVAKLIPAEAVDQPRHIPDFLGRIKKIYGDKLLKVSGAELLRWDRDR